ncbi:MAG TPA: YggS family pyridoxal phosphate-dependent enzyme [Wenzhouxiangella sp.]
MSSIKAAYLATVERIEAALAEAGREPHSAHLLAVSKTRTAQAIAQLAQLGQKAFGENYVSEGVAKIEALKDLGLEWHFIGPIQSNKTRAIAESFDWVHSIDRLKLITRLNDQRPPDRAPLNVLIQVNLDGETQKAGCAPADIDALADAIDQSPRLRLRGLMAIPAPRTERSEQVEVFTTLAAYFHDLQQKHPGVDALSAGMSDDLEAAIEAGANWVRVGTALFGPRASA